MNTTTVSTRAERHLRESLGDHYDVVLALADRIADSSVEDTLPVFSDTDAKAINDNYLGTVSVLVKRATDARIANIRRVFAEADGVKSLSDLSSMFGAAATGATATGAAGAGGMDLTGLLTQLSAAGEEAAKDNRTRETAALLLSMPADVAPAALLDDLYERAGVTR